MPVNIGNIDRLIRIAVGLICLCGVALLSGPWRWALLAGVLPLATGILGWCPMYAWFARD